MNISKLIIAKKDYKLIEIKTEKPDKHVRDFI